MNHKKFSMRLVMFLLFSMGFSAEVQAEINLDRPERLLERASKNLDELRRVITEIDLNVSEMRDGRVFDQYFVILPSLEELAKKHQLDNVYPQAVRRLGSRMVQKGIHWLSLKSDSAEKILRYHFWMEDTQASFTFLYASELVLESLTLGSPAEMTLAEEMGQKIETLIQYIDQRWKDESSLRVSYRNMLSLLAVRVLKKAEISDSQFSRWIGRVFRADFFSELLLGLQTEVHQVGLGKIQAGRIHFLINRLLIFNDTLRSSSLQIPESLFLLVGEAIAEALSVSIRLSTGVEKKQLVTILESMNSRALPALAQVWISKWKLVRLDAKRAIAYLDSGMLIAAQLKKAGWFAEEQSLKDFLHAKYVPAMIGRYNLEGMWTFKDSNKKEWALIIARADEDQVFTSLSDREGFVHRDSYYVTYSPDRHTFVCAKRKSDFGRGTNLPYLIRLTQDGQVRVGGVVLEHMDKEFLAKKIQSFPNLLDSNDSGPVASHLGVYEGDLAIPGLHQKKSQLFIEASNEIYFGSLNTKFTLMALYYGSQATGSVIYLTAGSEGGKGSFFQLRGKVEDNTFTAHIIVGGRGMLPQPIKFTKTNQPLRRNP